MSFPSSISLCMIVKNEENCIERCLTSATDLVDEIIIVDTGSTDNTISLCRKYTEKIYPFKWINDFSAARNFSLSFAEKDWILVLDADETISLKYLDYMNNLIHLAAEDTGGYYFDRINYKEQDDDNLCEWNDTVLRLFRNRHGFKYERNVHEFVDNSILSKNMKISQSGMTLHHFGFLKGEGYKEKSRFYLNLLLKQSERQAADHHTYIMLAAEYEKQQEFDKEEEALLTAEKISARKFDIHNKLGIFFAARRDNYKKAFEYFLSSASLIETEKRSIPVSSKTEFDLFFNISKCAYLLNNLDDASVFFDKAFAIDREEKELHKFAVNLFGKKKLPNKSIYFLNKLMKSDCNNPDWIFQAIVNYMTLNNPARVSELVNKLKNNFPEFYCKKKHVFDSLKK